MVETSSLPTREEAVGIEPFAEKLACRGLELRRASAHTLQLNIGFRCNQSCRHCHLAAGPDRPEMMSRETITQVVGFARRFPFQCLDVTGGAPELNPHLGYLLEQLAPLTPRLMLRSNLTALAEVNTKELLDLCSHLGVVIISSLPATNAGQTNAQRGEGVLEQSIQMLKQLNARGYGQPESGLELNLVSNPAGAFLPAAQCQAEKKFRQDLDRKWGLAFNSLFTFANVPLGRFRKWLKDSGNLKPYMERLAGSFNPGTLGGLMCRSLLSVSWDGYLYDCDFNLAAGLPLGGKGRQHVSEVEGPPAAGEPIATGDYCYACTAGSGFT